MASRWTTTAWREWRLRNLMWTIHDDAARDRKWGFSNTPKENRDYEDRRARRIVKVKQLCGELSRDTLDAIEAEFDDRSMWGIRDTTNELLDILRASKEPEHGE